MLGDIIVSNLKIHRNVAPPGPGTDAYDYRESFLNVVLPEDGAGEGRPVVLTCPVGAIPLKPREE